MKIYLLNFKSTKIKFSIFILGGQKSAPIIRDADNRKPPVHTLYTHSTHTQYTHTHTTHTVHTQYTHYTHSTHTHTTHTTHTPSSVSADDTSNFDDFDEEPGDADFDSSMIYQGNHLPFIGFTFNHENSVFRCVFFFKVKSCVQQIFALNIIQFKN